MGMKFAAAQWRLKQDFRCVPDDKSENRNRKNQAGCSVRNLAERAMCVFRLPRCPSMAMEDLYGPEHQQQQDRYDTDRLPHIRTLKLVSQLHRIRKVPGLRFDAPERCGVHSVCSTYKKPLTPAKPSSDPR